MRYVEWCTGNKVDPLLAVRSDIERYLAMQFADGARAASVNRRLSSLRRFLPMATGSRCDCRQSL